MTRWIHWAGPLLALIAGCSSGAMGMDRGPLDVVREDQPIQIDDAQIAQALASQPQLPGDVRVGVWFRSPPDDTWRWTFEERERVISAAEEIERVELFPISRGFVASEDLRALRLAGARHGAHAILVVEGRPDQRTSDNGWVATYPLLLPILFAPGQELDSHFSIDAQMYDVRNGFLYVTAEAEGLEEQQRSHLWIDHDGGLREAKRLAIEHLHGELGERLAHLVELPVADPPQPAAEIAPAEVPPAELEAAPEPTLAEPTLTEPTE